MRLSNGREIVTAEVRQGRPGERKWVGKVIASLPENPLHPYVSWGIASDDGEVYDAFGGFYCETLEEAEQTHRERRA
jgi:hypothetical protein